jgi:hypothetical protein
VYGIGLSVRNILSTTSSNKQPPLATQPEVSIEPKTEEPIEEQYTPSVAMEPQHLVQPPQQPQVNGGNNLTDKNQIQKYIKQNGQLGTVLYSETREVITKDKLPILYELLDDDEYAPYWEKVVRAIGYVSDDPDSVNVLLNYIQRNDNKKLDRFSITSKPDAFAMIGLIGGDMADSILRKSVTKEGARELTKDWIDEPLPETVDTARMIRLIQISSLIGLVFSGKPENLALVEKLYNEQKEISIRNHGNTELMLTLIDAMVDKDYIADTGLQNFLNMNSNTLISALSPYLEKYNFDLGN